MKTDKTDNLIVSEPKFKIGDLVECDNILGKFKIIDFWFDNAGRHNYLPKEGGFMYRLAFITKYGFVDKRKNTRVFDETRLSPL